MNKNPESIISRYKKLKAARITLDSEYQEIADVMLFNKSNILDESTGATDRTTEIYDFTAQQSNLILAAGQLSYIAPADDIWFNYEPQDDELKNVNSVQKFFQKASELTREFLASSNFYLELHENLIDRGAFAIGCLFVDDNDGELVFQNIKVGSYVVAENKHGIIDTVIREFELSATAAIDMFGADSLSKQITDAVKQDPDRKFKFLHAVYPNSDYDSEKAGAENMKFTSCYIENESKLVVKDGGYNEMPYIVSRFNKIDNSPYGYGPGFEVLPIIKQLNAIEKTLDILGEKHANPPILAPDTMAYDINSQAGGVTFFDTSNPNNVPREWQTTGRYDVGRDRAEEKRKFIREAFHVPMFQMIQMQEGTKTATEIIALENEKLITFHPTFARLVTELFNPLLERVFNILYRNGKFPDIPQELITKNFKISYKSKIALALKNLQSSGFLQFMQASSIIAQIKPDVLDYIDADKAFIQLATNFGVSSDWIKDEETVTQIREQRQQQQAAQAAAQLAAENPQAASDLANTVGDIM